MNTHATVSAVIENLSDRFAALTVQGPGEQVFCASQRRSHTFTCSVTKSLARNVGWAGRVTRVRTASSSFARRRTRPIFGECCSGGENSPASSRADWVRATHYGWKCVIPCTERHYGGDFTIKGRPHEICRIRQEIVRRPRCPDRAERAWCSPQIDGIQDDGEIAAATATLRNFGGWSKGWRGHQWDAVAHPRHGHRYGLRQSRRGKDGTPVEIEIRNRRFPAVIEKKPILKRGP